MPTCRQLTEEVSRYLDGELSLTELAALRVHLLMCPPCRVYLEQMKTTRDAVACLEQATPPDEVAAGLVDLYRSWLREREDDSDGPCG